MLLSQTMPKHEAVGTALEMMRAGDPVAFHPRGRDKAVISAQSQLAMEAANARYWESTKSRTHGFAGLRVVS